MAMSSPITLLTLPPELLEVILICSRSPRTVASISQTCRTLYTLVYATPDLHLWRELFLTTWDDPRPALEHRALVDPRIDPASWNWATEYRRRVSADKWLKAWRRDICPPDDTKITEQNDLEWRATALSVLSTVLDTLLTLQPFPASPLAALTDTVLTPVTISPHPTEDIGSSIGTRQWHFCLFEASRSGARLGRTVYGPHATLALTNTNSRDTVAELEPIPTPSLPPHIMRTLLASRAIRVRGLPRYTPILSGADHWGGDPLGDVFHRIICITGFVPIPPPLLSAWTCTSPTGSEFVPDRVGSASAALDVLGNWCGAGEDSELGTRGDEAKHEDDHDSDEEPIRGSPNKFPTSLQQHGNARVLARKRVYDIQYLRGNRLWGPFHIVARASFESHPGGNRVGGDRKGKFRERGKRASTSSGHVMGLGTLAWSMGMDIEPDEFDSDYTSDDSKDKDWCDPANPGQESSLDAIDTDTDVDMASMEPEHPFISLILATADAIDTAGIDPITNTTSTASRSRTRCSVLRVPPDTSVFPHEIKPHHLRPDYAYLASARIVMEANLRELFGNETREDIAQIAPGPRAGGVGMFWEDEDEILRARARSSKPVSSSHVSSTPAAAPSGIPAPRADSNTLEFADILSQFNNLEIARLGSACRYWGGWIERQKSVKRSTDGGAEGSGSLSEGNTGAAKPRIVTERAQLENPGEKGKEKEGKNEPNVPPLGNWEIGCEGEMCEGWDWAGVAGIWRRCVCWMDYRELLFFNLDPSKFLTLDTQEACRIIPMDLQVTGYTRAGLMPVYDTDERNNINILFPHSTYPRTNCTRYFRPPPVIHFSGVAFGSDRGMEDRRKVTGSVQLIGGGEVWWHLDTYPQEQGSSASSMPEWSSEAIQIGGIGSAVGLIGVWTGAEHERSDPLGPFWAWKVA